MPRGAAEGLARYAELWSTRGVRAWAEEWWALADDVADRVAPLLGAPRGSVSMQPSTTIATAIVAVGARLCARPPQGGHHRPPLPLDPLPARSLVPASTARASTIVRREPGAWGVALDRLLDAIDDVDRGGLRSPTSSSRAPGSTTRRALARRCRETGAFLVLDVFQSAGVVPLALRDWGVDAAVGGCLKWLCGGPGNCLPLRRSRSRRDARARDHRLGRARGTVRLRAAADPVARRARGRFTNGTPQVPALYAARAGLDVLGRDRHRARAREVGAR